MTRTLADLNHAPLWRRTVRLGGASIQATSLDRYVYLMLNRWGWMGAPEERTLRALVRPGMHAIDIGANVGRFTVVLADCVGPDGQVDAFEPEPTLSAALAQTLQINRYHNVRLHQVALGSAPGEATLVRGRHNSGDNRLRLEPDARPNCVKVPVTTLAAALGDRAAEVDFVKIDVQGWELHVFEGLGALLASDRPLTIFMEFWPFGLRAAGTDPTALPAFFLSRGFRLEEKRGDQWVPARAASMLVDELTGTRFTNLLAKRP